MTLRWNARWTPGLRWLALVAVCFCLWQLRHLAPAAVPAAQESDFQLLETLLTDGLREREGVEPGLPERFSALIAHSMFGKQAQSQGATGQPVGPTLQGIGIDYAFIKTTGGDVLMMRVGEEQDGIRVIRIAMNRVLIEYAGETRELTIYSGFGSDPLLKPDQGEEQ